MSHPQPAPPRGPPPQDPDRPIWVRARTEYEHALQIARALWPQGTADAVLQACCATLLIHFKDLKARHHAQQQGRGGGPPAGNGQRGAPRGSQPKAAPAPSLYTGPVPACPFCEGPMYDNRNDKKTPSSPDFRCKDKTCIDQKGRVNGVWVDRKTGQLELPKVASPAAGAGAAQESFDDFPEALESDDDLPF